MSSIDEGVLLRAAAHEIDAFLAGGRHESDLADAADSMARRLRDEGFASARVRHELLPAGEGAPPVGRLIIEEGVRAFVGEVTFPGATAFPAAELRKAFVPESDSLTVSAAPLRLQRIDSAVGATLARYRTAGYVDAVVGPAKVRWSADRTQADIEVPVTEGRKWTVTTVRVVGAGDDALARKVAAGIEFEGKPLTQRTAAVAAARARRFLAGRGHLEAKAEATVTTNAEKATAALEVRVTPGPLARAGAVRFAGLDRTDPDFARSLVPVREGAVLTQDQIDEASKELSDTGIFKSVVVETRKAPAAAGGAEPATDLEAAVREIEARTVDLELGLGSYEIVRGRIRHLDRNFLGRAASLDTDLTASFKGASLGSRYEDRYLLGHEVVSAISARVFLQEHPEFTERGAEFETSVRHEVADDVEVTTGYRLRSTQATGVDGEIAGAEKSPYERAGGLFAKIEWDHADDTFFPQRGTNAALDAFWSTPSLGADLDFIELGGAVSHFIPLGDHTILVLAARARTRHVLDDSKTLPIQERLFLGGEDSVRSFEQDELAPLNADGHAAGGLSATEFHVELRRRLRGNLDGAVFYDVGWVSPESFDLGGAPGQAIGVGLRYRLPVGPFRVDVAWNPGELYAASSRWAVHVAFGFAF